MVSLKRKYNGEEKTFTVADPLLFEVLTPPRSTYAYLQKFTAGMWSTADVALVLSFAIHGPTASLAQHWRFAKNMARFGSMSSAYDHLTYTPHPDVLAVVSKAPGDYAPLAIDILTELVFGDGASKGKDDE